MKNMLMRTVHTKTKRSDIFRASMADLPLHVGHTPRWLFDRMIKLGGLIIEGIVDNFGTEELLKRFSDSYWFQSLGCVIGFDWHSSGLTTTTLGALKQYLNKHDIGVKIFGGKGKVSLNTPKEIESSNLDLSSSKITKLKTISRLVAKVDSNLLQDGYSLYHHTLIVDERANWAIIQQGLNASTRYARRYHWIHKKIEDNKHSKNVQNYYDKLFFDPWNDFNTFEVKQIALNLASSLSNETRKLILDLVKTSPSSLIKDIKNLKFSVSRIRGGNSPSNSQLWDNSTLLKYFKSDTIESREGNKEGNIDNNAPNLFMPSQHSLTLANLTPKSIEQIRKILTMTYNNPPQNFSELVLTPGLGSKTILALTLVSELIYGTKADWQDPAKFSFAHGGKDGWPYPVDKSRYDQTIQTLRQDIYLSKIKKDQAKKLLKRLYYYFTRPPNN